MFAVTALLTAGALAAPAAVDTNFLLVGRSDKVERWGICGAGASAIWTWTNDVLRMAPGDLGGLAPAIRSLAFSPDGTRLAVLAHDPHGRSRLLQYVYNLATHTATPAGTNAGGALLAADVGESWAACYGPNDTNLYVSTGTGAPGFGSVVLRVQATTGAKSAFTPPLTRGGGLCFGPDFNGDGRSDLFVVDIECRRVAAFDGVTGARLRDDFMVSVGVPTTIAFLANGGGKFYLAGHNIHCTRLRPDGIEDGVWSDANDPVFQMAGLGPPMGVTEWPVAGFYAVDGSGRVIVYRGDDLSWAGWFDRKDPAGHYLFAPGCGGGITFDRRMGIDSIPDR
ncbi:MAG: hypothetical protein WCR06_05050 [bacterium]